MLESLLIGMLATSALYAAAVGALMVAGRRSDAAVLARFVPDFVPVAGQLDDAVLLALALRHVVGAAGPDAVRAHWPGPERSLAVVLRLAQRPGGWRTT